MLLALHQPVGGGGAQLSPTLQPHSLQPTRLLGSWNFVGKNTGVGCHLLLQGDLPNSGIEPLSPVLAGRFFTTEPPGRPLHQPNSLILAIPDLES